MNWVVGILSFAFFLSPYFSIAAEAPIGSIKTLKGSAVVIRQSEKIPVESGTEIFMGDSLKTGSDSSLGIIFKDDTVLSLGSQSEITVDEFLFSPAEGKLSLVVRFLKGTATCLTGIIAKLSPESVRFETPIANIGIRGTKFAVKVGSPGGH